MSAVIPVIASLVGATPVALYTWSAGTAECETLDICNRLTTVVKVDLYLNNNGTNVYEIKGYAIDAGATLAWRGAIPMNSTGQVLTIVSDTAAALDVLGRVTEF